MYELANSALTICWNHPLRKPKVKNGNPSSNWRISQTKSKHNFLGEFRVGSKYITQWKALKSWERKGWVEGIS